MTRTEATSRILMACGLRAPQDDVSSRNAVLAGQFLDHAHADIQRIGWPENSEDRVELARDSTTNKIKDAEMRVGLDANISLL